MQMLNVQMNFVRDKNKCIELFKVDPEKREQDSAQNATLYLNSLPR